MEIDDKILANEKLIYYTINKFFPNLKDDEDMIQIGRIALWKAILKEPNEKAFSSYAVNSIKNAMLNELKKRTALKRAIGKDCKIVYLYESEEEIESEKDRIPHKLIEIKDYRENTDEIKRNILDLITEGYNLKEISQKLEKSYSKIYRLWKEIKEEIS